MASLKITAADFVVYLKPGGGCGSSCSDSQGVLAPKGWHCFETEGANGSTIVVTRQPIGKDDWITSRWNTYFKGPLVEVSTAYAGTSGRFEVAAICARVFPAQKAYVQYVIHENIRPASDFPFGAYAADKLTRRNATRSNFTRQQIQTDSVQQTLWLETVIQSMVWSCLMY